MGKHGSMNELREQAMEALEESTTMLKVACNLLEQGNLEEAARLRDQARAKRSVSVWLMSKANRVEKAARGLVPSRNFQPHSTVH
jgi:hypothetical protein